MLELILSKKSSESEIKSYFNAVLELSKSDNEFPINLDEVWMLVYGRKEEAVRALTSSEQFIENIDYQVLRKNAENQKAEDLQMNTNLPFPVWSFLLLAKYVQFLRFIGKCFTKWQSMNFPERSLH